MSESGDQQRARRSTDDKPECEAGDHSSVQRFEGADIEKHPGLGHDQHETDWNDDRDQDQEREGHPLRSLRQQEPRSDQRNGQRGENSHRNRHQWASTQGNAQRSACRCPSYCSADVRQRE